MTPPKELIALAAAATAGSRELDKAVWEAFGKCAHRETTYYYVQGDSGFDCNVCGKCPSRDAVPNVTTSVDAALALMGEVLPGWGYKIEAGLGYPISVTVGHVGENRLYDRPEGWGTAQTLPLALCVALLTTLEPTHER
jgi:hypothetical protein